MSPGWKWTQQGSLVSITYRKSKTNSVSELTNTFCMSTDCSTDACSRLFLNSLLLTTSVLHSHVSVIQITFTCMSPTKDRHYSYTLLKLGCSHKRTKLKLTPHCHIKCIWGVNLEGLSEHHNFNRAVGDLGCLNWDMKTNCGFYSNGTHKTNKGAKTLNL